MANRQIPPRANLRNNIATLALVAFALGAAMVFAAMTPDRHGFGETVFFSAIFGFIAPAVILAPIRIAHERPDLIPRLCAVVVFITALTLFAVFLWCAAGGPNAHLDTLFGGGL